MEAHGERSAAYAPAKGTIGSWLLRAVLLVGGALVAVILTSAAASADEGDSSNGAPGSGSHGMEGPLVEKPDDSSHEQGPPPDESLPSTGEPSNGGGETPADQQPTGQDAAEATESPSEQGDSEQSDPPTWAAPADEEDSTNGQNGQAADEEPVSNNKSKSDGQVSPQRDGDDAGEGGSVKSSKTAQGGSSSVQGDSGKSNRESRARQAGSRRDWSDQGRPRHDAAARASAEMHRRAARGAHELESAGEDTAQTVGTVARGVATGVGVTTRCVVADLDSATRTLVRRTGQSLNETTRPVFADLNKLLTPVRERLPIPMPDETGRPSTEHRGPGISPGYGARTPDSAGARLTDRLAASASAPTRTHSGVGASTVMPDLASVDGSGSSQRGDAPDRGATGGHSELPDPIVITDSTPSTANPSVPSGIGLAAYQSGGFCMDFETCDAAVSYLAPGKLGSVPHPGFAPD